MVQWLRDRPWFVAAFVLSVGVPCVVLAGLLLGVFGLWLTQAVMRLPAGGPLGAGIWIFIAALTGLALWLLVRRCARIGRWKAVGISLGAIAVLAVLSSVVGDVEARMWPDNGMAGVGAGIFAWILALFGIVVLAMGAVSIVLDDRRRPRRASEEARVVDPA